MSAYEHILTEIEDGVGIVTMNRPEVLNAMNHKLGVELRDAVQAMAENDDVGCLVITGTGKKAFSAGGDIHEQRTNDRNLTPKELDDRNTISGRGSYEISACQKPVIGMMNGLAYGGASVLSSSLDMRIGCENTKFRFLAAAYGRINCTNQVGWPMAKELLFTARILEAEEAYRIGLLNHLVPASELRTKTMEIAKMIADNDRASVIGVKQLMLRGRGENLAAQWQNEQDYTRHILRGAKAEDAFPDFIARKGRE